MKLAKDFEDFVALLNIHHVDYMVVGGYALPYTVHPGIPGIWIFGSIYLKRMLSV